MNLAISMPRATDTSFFNNHVTILFLLLTLSIGLFLLFLVFKQNYEHFKQQLQQEKEVKFQKRIKKEFRNSSLVCLIILLIMVLLIIKIGFNWLNWIVINEWGKALYCWSAFSYFDLILAYLSWEKDNLIQSAGIFFN